MTLQEEIPGLAEAVRREAFVRDAAFLGVTENIAGFEVRQMTLGDYVALRITASPFLVGGEEAPSAKDICALLWRLSPDYTPAGGRAKKATERRCEAMVPPLKPRLPLPWLMQRWCRRVLACIELQGRVLIAIRAYLDETMQDWPGGKGSSGVYYYSDAATIVAMLAREYGWSEQAILALPMKRVLQYLNEIKQHHGAKVLFNPSDRVTAEWLRKQNTTTNTN